MCRNGIIAGVDSSNDLYGCNVDRQRSIARTNEDLIPAKFRSVVFDLNDIRSRLQTRTLPYTGF